MNWTKENVIEIVKHHGNSSNQDLFNEIYATIKLIEGHVIDKEKYWQEIFKIMDVWSNDFVGQTYNELFVKLKIIAVNIKKDNENANIELQKQEDKKKKKKIIVNSTYKVLIWLSGTIISAVIIAIVGLAIGGKL